MIVGFTLTIFSCHRESISSDEDRIIPEVPEVQKRPIPFDSIMTQDEIDLILALVDIIPQNIVADFRAKYTEWINTWNTVMSNEIYDFALSDEYFDLLDFCRQYDKAIWPYVLRQICIMRHDFCLNLLRDLTFEGDMQFKKYLTNMEETTGSRNMYYNMQVYCKKLLEEEKDNILRSILDIPEQENEAFETNTVTVSNQEILINLNSEKSETAAVKIYSIAGFIEYEANYNVAKGGQSVVIDASNFKKGIYVIQVKTGGKTISKKFNI